MIDKRNMQRILIILGVIILIVGILWPWIIKLTIGKLPGDIIINKPNFKVYLPITTMIIISLLLTLIFWLFKK
jgi:membrane protein implicated in regulation of membrane protease activity